MVTEPQTSAPGHAATATPPALEVTPWTPNRPRHYMHTTGRWWELDLYPEVARAVGMTAAQLDCRPHDAATVLRSHAAAHAQDAVDVALDIVHRRLTFAP